VATSSTVDSPSPSRKARARFSSDAVTTTTRSP
jgi:hypothetical protein